jgi:hypothetical protein
MVDEVLGAGIGNLGKVGVVGAKVAVEPVVEERVGVDNFALGEEDNREYSGFGKHLHSSETCFGSSY